jgi:hypothetical protein
MKLITGDEINYHPMSLLHTHIVVISLEGLIESKIEL